MPDKDLRRDPTFKQVDHLTLNTAITQVCSKDFAAVVHPHVDYAYVSKRKWMCRIESLHSWLFARVGLS
jgi:hypothetical protein